MVDCPSGELSRDQFCEMYSKVKILIFIKKRSTSVLIVIKINFQIFPSGNADNFSKNIFRTFDTNNSGTIDFR